MQACYHMDDRYQVQASHKILTTLPNPTLGAAWIGGGGISLVRLCLGPRQLASPDCTACGQPVGAHPTWQPPKISNPQHWCSGKPVAVVLGGVPALPATVLCVCPAGVLAEPQTHPTIKHPSNDVIRAPSLQNHHAVYACEGAKHSTLVSAVCCAITAFEPWRLRCGW